LEGLLKYISSQLGLSNKPTLAKFQEAIEELSREQGIYPILCLDEFEHLTKRKDQFPNEVFEVWRSLASGSRLAFITSSQTSLGQLIQQGNLTSTFHNIFIYLELGNFTEAEARTLLARNTDHPFSEEEISKLFKLANYHPTHLQLAAKLLYEAKESPPVDWNVLKTHYQKQLDNIKPFEPVHPKLEWFSSLKNFFFNIPNRLGRFVLDVFGRHDAKDSSATILGWILLFVGAAILFGFWKAQDVVDFFKYNWHFFFPEKK
jgi:hypothetical protein